MGIYDDLIAGIDSRDVNIGIIGLGYVGLPLAMAFVQRGFSVYGYDKSHRIIETLQNGRSHIMDVPSDIIKRYIGSDFRVSDSEDILREVDIYIITVPTPLREDRKPDLSYVISAAHSTGTTLARGNMVILESTTYPGTTEDVVLPILEDDSGLKCGSDFGLAYSPERIDPGNKKYSVEKIPKIVGGIDAGSTEVAYQLYSAIIESVHRVSSPRTAEAVKMVENIFRNVNIALINEMAVIFERMGIDTWEVIEAAATKPYGFMPFYPGPGIGGHCIPLDPFYMAYIARRYGFIPRFIETAGEINEYMKFHTVNLVETLLRRMGRSIRGTKVGVFGLSYKKNIDDVRESPSIEVIEELVHRGAEVRVNDPLAPGVDTRVGYFPSEDIYDVMEWSDVLLFMVDHDAYRDIDTSVFTSKGVVDTKNLFPQMSGSENYIGLGKPIEKGK